MDILDSHTYKLPKVAGTALINATPESWDPQEGQWYSIGIHPWNVTSSTNTSILRTIAQGKQVLAIGETGLDKLKGAPLSVQEKCFREHIHLSETVHKPLLIHCVHAMNEVLNLRRELKPSQTWIVHGFRGKPTTAEQWMKAGLFLTFGTKFAEESLKNIPLDYLLLETDDSNETIATLCQTVADLRHLTVETVTELLKKNNQKIFGDSL